MNLKNGIVVAHFRMRLIIVEIPEHLAEELEKIHDKPAGERLKEIILRDFSLRPDHPKQPV